MSISRRAVGPAALLAIDQPQRRNALECIETFPKHDSPKHDSPKHDSPKHDRLVESALALATRVAARSAA